MNNIDIKAPIIPNGHFTWAEALHYPATRWPSKSEHFENIKRLAEAIQPYRVRSGCCWYVTSWYRPEPWNSQAGGAKNSFHLVGLAMDFWTPCPRNRILEVLEDWPGGLGVYSDWYHLDLGPRRRW